MLDNITCVMYKQYIIQGVEKKKPCIIFTSYAKFNNFFFFLDNIAQQIEFSYLFQK